MIYLICEGIVYGDGGELAYHPFNGGIYTVEGVDKAPPCTLLNSSDWGWYDAPSAGCALALGVLADSRHSSRINRKLDHLRSLKDWVVTGTSAYHTPNATEKEWFQSQPKNRDLWEVTAAEWLTFTNPIPYTVSKPELKTVIENHNEIHPDCKDWLLASIEMAMIGQT